MSLENYLKQCDLAYFNGKPILPDEVYDRLKISQNTIGYEDMREQRIAHTYPMWSLQKVFQGDPAPDWANSPAVVVTPKLDGAAISLLYVEGQLTLALTRGDGIKGVPITDKAAMLVPCNIETDRKILQITGEVVAPKDIPNSRNYAAGSLNLKDMQEFVNRELYFVAHGVEPALEETYVQDMSHLIDLGFVTSVDVNDSMFPTDGSVFRIGDNETYYSQGYTSSFPKGAFALKAIERGIVTVLLGVEWNVGKSGAVTPVAILDPIDIDGATISRATLHNAGFIKALDLHLGCEVEVIRSGKIIPKIIRKVE